MYLYISDLGIVLNFFVRNLSKRWPASFLFTINSLIVFSLQNDYISKRPEFQRKSDGSYYFLSKLCKNGQNLLYMLKTIVKKWKTIYNIYIKISKER